MVAQAAELLQTYKALHGELTASVTLFIVGAIFAAICLLFDVCDFFINFSGRTEKTVRRAIFAVCTGVGLYGLFTGLNVPDPNAYLVKNAPPEMMRRIDDWHEARKLAIGRGYVDRDEAITFVLNNIVAGWQEPLVRREMGNAENDSVSD